MRSGDVGDEHTDIQGIDRFGARIRDPKSMDQWKAAVCDEQNRIVIGVVHPHSVGLRYTTG
ncbi:MAG: hypothetical protein R3A47_07945 [Polyangiales bacterium]